MVTMRDLMVLTDALRAGKIVRAQFLCATATFGVGTAALAAIGLPAFANANATPTYPPKKTKYSIGFSQSELNSDWRKAESDSMAAEAKKRAAKYDYRQTVANGDTKKQINDVADLIAANVDLIVLTPREQVPLAAATAKARAAGIPVIEIDRTTTGQRGYDFVTAITSNFVQQGNKVALWMLENTKGPISYVELLGTTGASPAILRAKGFHDVIDKEKRFALLGAQDGDFTLAGGQTVMTNFLARFGQKIDMFYAHNDDMAVGGYQAIREAGFAKKIYIGSIDGTKRAIQYVAEGVFSVVVQSDPHFGPVTFEAIDKYFDGQAIPGNITVKDVTYTKVNAGRLIGTGF
jgi:ABC-type sugar transport system substrate-binding protein